MYCMFLLQKKTFGQTHIVYGSLDLAMEDVKKTVICRQGSCVNSQWSCGDMSKRLPRSWNKIAGTGTLPANDIDQVYHSMF